MKRLSVILAIILCAITLTGCGESEIYYDSDSSYDSVSAVGTNGFIPSYTDYDDSYNESYDYKSDPVTEETKQISNEKLVYTCSINIETTSYTDDIKVIRELIKEFDGIIENENEIDEGSNWYYDSGFDHGLTVNTLAIRIPSSRYTDFVNSAGAIGHVVAKTQNVSNITQSYYDNKSTIESLKIQEQRLLDMYESAYTIEDMIRVEQRLTEVQSQLKIYQTRLSQMDTDVQYATVSIRLQEVKVYTPDKKEDTFFTRLWNTIESTWYGFLDFLEGVLFLLIRSLPYIPLMYIVYLIWKRVKKHAEKTKLDVGPLKK